MQEYVMRTGRCFSGYEVLLAAFMCFFGAVSVVNAAEADSVVGVWDTQDHDAKIEIFKCEGGYCGKIVWMDEPNYTAKDKEGKPGELKLDTKNPDPSLRGKPILGLQLMRNFVFDGGNRWTGGKVYDPETGNSYSASLTLASINKLHLRGYILIPLFGRTAVWTRGKK